jgi:geranylgeranyl transferase type-1 subunit beta
VLTASQLLDHVSMMKMDPSRAYLLDITQHYIGGFSKTAGGPPDIFHSYLGLASLALMGKDGIKDFDVGLCCSQDITDRIVLARAGLDQAQERSWAEDGFWQAINSSTP